MRQLYIGIAVLGSIGASLLLGGCGSGAKSYAPVATTKGTYTVSIRNAVLVKHSTTRDVSADQTVLWDEDAVYTVTVSSTDGFTGTVDLAVLGLDSGIGASFDTSSSVTLSGSVTSATRTLRVGIVNEGVTYGTRYPFTVAGTSGALQDGSNDASVTFEITQDDRP